MDAIMEASLGQIVGGAVGIFALLSIFIEITPIKFNPISLMLKWIGERTNNELKAKMDILEKKVDDIAKSQTDVDEKLAKKDATDCRVRILRFSDELRCDMKHSKESFDQVLTDIDDYERYCATHPHFKNNKTVVANSRILSAYQSCLDKDNFL